MKKIILCMALFTIMITKVHAESYCVMTGDDHSVVEGKDIHKTQSVASISKIMTAIIAIEHGNLTDTWPVSEAVLLADGSSIYLKVGQEVSLESLLYGLMLRSGNDAAIEIAMHISGSKEAFVELMNMRAKELGMNDTTFRNPSGLDEEDGGNISSAYDMALLMSYAMRNTVFQTITGSQYYTNEWNLRWKNKNKLLFEYAQTTGGKTGFTKKAGRTLVSSASKDTTNSVVVTLSMADDFKFHQEKHDEVFEQIEPYVLLKQGTYYIDGYEITLDQPLTISLHKNGLDRVDINSYMEHGIYTIEVIKNDEHSVFTYEGKRAQKGIGGWFS